MSMFGFPALHRRYKTLSLYVATMALWALALVLIFVTSIIARKLLRNDLAEAPPLGVVWIGVILIVFVANVAAQAFS